MGWTGHRRRFLVREEGASMVEYGLMLFLVAAALAAIAGSIGQITATLLNVSASL